MGKKNEPRGIQEVLDAVLRGLDMVDPIQERMVFEVWEEALGAELARQIKPVAVHRGKLVALVRDSAWLQELQFVRAEIVRKLNAAAGRRVVREIRFKVGAWAEEQPALEQESISELPAEIVAEAEAAAARIEDPVIRRRALAALLALARKHMREEGKENI